MAQVLTLLIAGLFEIVVLTSVTGRTVAWSKDGRRGFEGLKVIHPLPIALEDDPVGNGSQESEKGH